MTASFFCFKSLKQVGTNYFSNLNRGKFILNCLRIKQHKKLNKMKKLKLGLLVVFAVVSVTSCKKGGVFCYKGNGNIVTEVRNVTGFTEVSLGLAADVIYTQSDDYFVSIEASDNLMEFIETDVQGSELEIDFKKNKCYNSKEPITITISSPNINALAISGSGSITSKNKLTTNTLKVSISGSGDMELDSLDLNQFNASISGSGELTAASVEDVDNQDISISGSGSINFLNMPTLNSDISVSGSGNCDVNVLNTLKVDISGSGNVRYKGNPAVTSNTSGSGSIKPY